MEIQNSFFSIAEILEMLEQRRLVVNSDYQRGTRIWPSGPSSYFIDTILEKFPFPKIYIYEVLGREDRRVQKEIVDGQQRINTIQRFHSGEFAISGESSFKGLRFSELPEEIQLEFLSYTVAVDTIRGASRAEILQMFRRMNAYTLPLNDAEKRHSEFQGDFKWEVNGIADEMNEFFVQFGIFTDRQIVRMSDASMIADIILAMENGIVSTSPTMLRGLYKKYDRTFENAEEYRQKLFEAVGFITTELADLRKTFIMKPYAFHSLMVALIHNKFGIEEINREFGMAHQGTFAVDVRSAKRELLAMAAAHEGKELEGPYAGYVWGASSTTDRKARRTARIMNILRALGNDLDPKLLSREAI